METTSNITRQIGASLNPTVADGIDIKVGNEALTAAYGLDDDSQDFIPKIPTLPSAAAAMKEVYDKYEEIYSINIASEGIKNLNALYECLANLKGPLSDEMRKVLSGKLPTKHKTTAKPGTAITGTASAGSATACQPLASTVTVNAESTASSLGSESFTASYDNEEQKLLAEISQILTPEELIVFKKLYDEKWFLRHDTGLNRDDIQYENNDFLLSTKQVVYGEKSITFHPNRASISRDIISFNFEIGDHNQYAGRTQSVLANYNALSNMNNDPLLGLWMGDHHFKDKCNQKQSKGFIKIFDVKYWVDYRVVLSDQDKKEMAAHKTESDKNKTSPSEIFYKIYNYQYPDGSVKKKYVTMRDEIFMQSHLQVVLILKAIEHTRLLGPAAWRCIIQEGDIKTLKDVVQIFSLNETLIHQPKFLQIVAPSVTIFQPHYENHYHDYYEGIENNKLKLLKPLTDAVLQGKSDFVTKELRNSPLTIYEMLSPGHNNFGLLLAAIYACQPLLVEQLLKLLNQSKNFSKKTETNDEIMESAFAAALSLSNSEHVDSIYRENLKPNPKGDQSAHGNQAAENIPAAARDIDVKDAKDIKDNSENSQQKLPNLKQRIEHSITILKLLFDYQARFNKNPNILNLRKNSRGKIISSILLYKTEPEIVIAILPIFSIPNTPDSNDYGLPFYLAIYLRSIDLAAQMIKMGKDINSPFYSIYIAKESMPDLLPGMTPLMLAVVLGDDAMVDFLTNPSQANPIQINAVLISTESCSFDHTHAQRISEKEGYSALMFAITPQNGKENIIKRLLTAKANPYQTATNGLNAVTLTAKLNPGLAKMFSGMPNILSAPSSSQLKLMEDTAAKDYPVHEHVACVIIKMLVPNNNHYFPIVINGDFLLPFFSMMQGHFSFAKLVYFLNQWFHSNLNDSNCTLHDLGTLSFGSKANSCHFAHNICLLEINPSIGQTILKHFPLSGYRVSDLEPNVDVKLQKENSKIPSNISTLTLEVLKTISRMQKVRAFDSNELRDLNARYTKTLENQTKLIAHLQKKEHKEALELILTIPKIDVNIATPFSEKNKAGNYYEPEYQYPMTVAKDQISAEDNNSARTLLSEIIKHLIPVGTKPQKILSEKMKLFSAAEFKHWLASQYAIVTEQQFNSILAAIFNNDRVELFKAFEEYMTAFIPFIHGKNRMQGRKEIINKLFEEAVTNLSFNIVNSLLCNVNKDTLQKSLFFLIRSYSDTDSFHNKKEDETKIEKMIKLLLPLSQIESSSLIKKMESIKNIPLLRIILPLVDLERVQLLEVLERMFFLNSYDPCPDICQYLLTEYFLKPTPNQKLIDQLLVTFGGGCNVAVIQMLVSHGSPDAIKTAFNRAFGPTGSCYYHYNRENVRQILTLFLAAFQANAIDIANVTKVAIALKDMVLIDILKRFTKISREAEHYINFPEKISITKGNSEFMTALLNSLVDEQGHWSLFLPIVSNLEKSKENSEFLDHYFRKEYPKKAEKLLRLLPVISADDAGTLRRSLTAGIDPNACLYVKKASQSAAEISSWQRVSLIELAKKNRRYACMELLLELGVILYHENSPFNSLSHKELNELIACKQHKILALLLKNNLELDAIWNHLNKSYSKSSMQYCKEITSFFHNLKTRLASFEEAIKSRNFQAVEKMAPQIPQYLLKNELNRLVTCSIQLTQDELFDLPLDRAGKNVTLGTVNCIIVLLQHMKTLNAEDLFLLLFIFALAKNFGDKALQQKIKMIPCVANHTLLLWLDSIRYLDREQLNVLLKQNKDLQSIQPAFNDPLSQIQKEKLGLIGFAEPLNPITLFVFACRKHGFINRQNEAVAFFKMLLLMENIDLTDIDNNLKKLDFCPNPTLKDSLEKALSKAFQIRKNWAAISVVSRFLSSNRRSPIKDSFLPNRSSGIGLVSQILDFSGYEPNAAVIFDGARTQAQFLKSRYYTNLDRSLTTAAESMFNTNATPTATSSAGSGGAGATHMITITIGSSAAISNYPDPRVLDSKSLLEVKRIATQSDPLLFTFGAASATTTASPSAQSTASASSASSSAQSAASAISIASVASDTGITSTAAVASAASTMDRKKQT